MIRDRVRALPTGLGILRARLVPWARSRFRRMPYRVLGESELRATRRSDTVFIFGSGASLNDLTPEECAEFERHDTLGFNWFVHERFVRCDYHMVREVAGNDLDPAIWKPALAEYFGAIRANPNYTHTVFLVQSGFRAINANRALAGRLLPLGAPIFRWRSLGGRLEPSRALADGLARRHATLEECVNFAFLLGWSRIVLVGVDLYDRRYYWLGPDEARALDERRGAVAADPHSQATTGLVERLAAWAGLLRAEGVTVEVYNPRSLLAAVLPTSPRLPGGSPGPGR